MNSTWHNTHPMPTHPTEAQARAWHAAHQAACGCQEMPASLKAVVDPPMTPPTKRPKPLHTAPDCD
ncbi:MAG TPA: hypothetical protein VLF60_05240 [Candidatus Saccharimonadales bacterium]|nr:hypothetical protein [Candidatus Saccharimonadales bacterium]